MKGTRLAWIVGVNVTINESMIKYCGNAIEFVQYMPKKPIKHGIKVFAVCCAYTAVLLGFEFYVETDTVDDGMALGVVKRLIEGTGLTDNCGRMLYTDNWYSSMVLATTLFTDYCWRFCGTM